MQFECLRKKVPICFAKWYFQTLRLLWIKAVLLFFTHLLGSPLSEKWIVPTTNRTKQIFRNIVYPCLSFNSFASPKCLVVLTSVLAAVHVKKNWCDGETIQYHEEICDFVDRFCKYHRDSDALHGPSWHAILKKIYWKNSWISRLNRLCLI